MHVPKQFQISDFAIIEQFIKEVGLATVISKGSEFPMGTHIPMELTLLEDGTHVLRGHISKTNEQCKDFEKDANALVVFLSPVHGYVSSSWYFHANAPTYNYMSVHIHGLVRFLDSTELWSSVKDLTNRYEQDVEHPVSLDTLPASVQKQMDGIMGIEISIETIDAAFKLSQNRNEEDFFNVVKHLKESNNLSARLLATAMERERIRKV